MLSYAFVDRPSNFRLSAVIFFVTTLSDRAKVWIFCWHRTGLACLCLIIFKKCQATDLNCFEHLLKKAFFHFLFQGGEKAGNNNVLYLLLLFNFVSTLPSGVVLGLPNLDLLRTGLLCFCSFHWYCYISLLKLFSIVHLT